MTSLFAFSIIGFAALIHASFQLSISTLTLLSGHTLSAKRSHLRLLHLLTNFISGAIVMTTLLIAATALFATILFSKGIPSVVWAALCGMLFGIGLAVWLFYYRSGNGTLLWIPRPMARYLQKRCKATHSGSEAFSLGLVSVLGEILFLIGPIIVAALALLSLQTPLQIAGIFMYVIIAVTPLLIVGCLVSGGKLLSEIQRWREKNKRFLQFSAGTALLILGFYLYVNEVVAVPVLRGVL